MMKKIVVTIFACSITCSSFASSHNNQGQTVDARTLQRRQARGAQVNNLQASALQTELIEELHESTGHDDLQSLMEHSRSQIFTRHLIAHFSAPVVEYFINTVTANDRDEMQVVEQHVDQAVNNYFQTQRPRATIAPATAQENPVRHDALVNYLVALRDIHNHLDE